MSDVATACIDCQKPIAVRKDRLATNPARRCWDCHLAARAARPGLRPDGYREVRVATNDRRLEHRVVAEQSIGRPLRKGEVVHHLNHDRTDNRPENLVVCRTAGEHLRDYHLDRRWRGRKP